MLLDAWPTPKSACVYEITTLIFMNDVYGCVKLVKANVMISFFLYLIVCSIFLFNALHRSMYSSARFLLLKVSITKWFINRISNSMCLCIGCTLLRFLRIFLCGPACRSWDRIHGELLSLLFNSLRGKKLSQLSVVYYIDQKSNISWCDVEDEQYFT
jgi:hypothetical protein